MPKGNIFDCSGFPAEVSACVDQKRLLRKMAGKEKRKKKKKDARYVL